MHCLERLYRAMQLTATITTLQMEIAGKRNAIAIQRLIHIWRDNIVATYAVNTGIL